MREEEEEKAGCLCAPHLFPSDSPKCPESVHSGSRRGAPPGSLVGTWQARWWVSPLNAQGISRNDWGQQQGQWVGEPLWDPQP